MPRYLFGPVDAAFAADHLHAARSTGDCLAFGRKPDPDLDIFIKATDSWSEILARLPAGWVPDCIVLYLNYTIIPHGLWSAPLPLVGLAGDANLLWTCYRRLLPRCDIILADTPAATALKRSGLDPVLSADLYGCGRSWLTDPAEGERDIDLLFVGNLYAAVQRERQRWLGRLAALADRWRVRIASGIFGEAYRALMRRARIVFNRSIRGEFNQRVAEVVSSGALLFQERGNKEVAEYFGDPAGCVFYDENDLEALLDHYLSHESERLTLVQMASRRAPALSFDQRWNEAVTRVVDALPVARQRAATRPAVSIREGLLLRVGQWLSSAPQNPDPSLTADLVALLEQLPNDAELHHTLGLVRSGHGAVALAADSFRQATSAPGSSLLSGLSLAGTLVALNQVQPAVDEIHKLLLRLNEVSDHEITAPYLGIFPPIYNSFRIEWERAGYDHAGNPWAYAQACRVLLRWRLHELLASLTGDLTHYYEAAVARPDMAATRAALGCALARAGNTREAVGHLRWAVETNPLDRMAARALFQALTDAGYTRDANAFASRRRLLCRAAPDVVPEEPWFSSLQSSLNIPPE
jgi:tetratricopeptide (TPR) repeat protein